MKIVGNMLVGYFLKRPNRFLALVQLEKTNEKVWAHVPDPGRLKELLLPHTPVILSESSNPKRKTRFSLVGVKKGEIWVNIDSILSNKLFKDDFSKIKHFMNYRILKSEFRFGSSRIDFLLENKTTSKQTLVEVKSATLVEDGLALFPDAPTIRGARHVKELIEAVKQSFEACIVFIIKREDAKSFAPNWKMDRNFAKILSESYRHGVQIFAVTYHYDPIEKLELTYQTEIPITQLS